MLILFILELSLLYFHSIHWLFCAIVLSVILCATDSLNSELNSHFRDTIGIAVPMESSQWPKLLVEINTFLLY